ncbi:MAG: hypothetical protein QJR04_25220 [Burkholderia multivorans]|nr:hypothetical protein [Burkholderia multivorans]
MYIPIDLPPGVYANGTEYEAKGRWRLANLIRWYNGRMRPIGGWQRFTKTPIAAPARAVITWRDNNGVPRAGFGSASNLYYTDGSLIIDITPTGLAQGYVDASGGDGFGAGDYSDDTYGTPRTAEIPRDATTWHLDNFGQVMLALSTGDGRLFAWDAGNQTPQAQLVTAAPTQCKGMFVTDERMVVMLGAGGNPREIMWSNQNDYTNWTIDETTTAGDLQLHSNGRVLSGCRMPGLSLIFTDTDVHALNYVGYPYIYGTQRLGTACGIIAPKAFAATQNFCAWMGNLGFFIYNGVVAPLPCDVAEAVFDNLNRAQQSKVIGGVNSQFNEVWWFFPSSSSTENDSYVFWNFKENHWGLGIGALGRTAWADREVWPNPIGASGDGNLYEHESGWTAAGLTRAGMVSAESGPIDLGNGDAVMCVSQLLTDTNIGPGAVNISFKTKMTPNGAETLHGPYPMRPDGYTDARFSGRQVKMRLDLAEDGLFQFGAIRLDAIPGGRR